jgi:pSer/pThr/pTyr-binding forkhead associated (FHA) protein
MHDDTITRFSPAPDPKDPAGPRAQVVVLDGESRGLVVDLPAELTIGRRPDNGLVLSSPSISKYHARIVCVASRFSLEDLGSTNGTFVNNVQLPPASALSLAHGDSLRLGDYTLLFRQHGTFSDEKTGMSTISFDRSKVQEEVERLLNGLPGLPRRE